MWLIILSSPLQPLFCLLFCLASSLGRGACHSPSPCLIAGLIPLLVPPPLSHLIFFGTFQVPGDVLSFCLRPFSPPQHSHDHERNARPFVLRVQASATSGSFRLFGCLDQVNGVFVAIGAITVVRIWRAVQMFDRMQKSKCCASE